MSGRGGLPGVLVLVPPPWAGRERIGEALEELRRRGYRVVVRGEPDCGPGVFNISWRPLPEGCPGARVPHAGMIVEAVECLERSGAWSDPERAITRCLLERLASLRGSPAAFTVRGVPVPGRPPPLLVASEIYARGPVEEVCAEAERRVGEGADLVVLGLDSWSRVDVERYLETLGRCARRLATPILADPGRIDLLELALSAGASGLMSISPGQESLLPEHAKSEALIVVLAHRSPAEAARTAGRLAKPVLDPVVTPPVSPGLLHSLERLHRLSQLWSGPIMAGINNAYELIDADPTGTIPLLTALAAEGGATIILVTEESPKAYGATLLARLSADLTSLALNYNSPPKDYPIRLLLARDKRARTP